MASADVKYRCFAGRLAWATKDQSLELAFSRYGDIVESKIINDRETGRSRGFGFVTFINEKSMRDVIEGMNDQNLNGRNIMVNEAQSHGNGVGYSRGGRGRGYGDGGRREGGGGYSCGGEGYGGGGGGYGGGGYGGARNRAKGDIGSKYLRGGGGDGGSWRN